jgi:hypothetical protein
MGVAKSRNSNECHFLLSHPTFTVVYSFLDWVDKIAFISLSKEISANSRTYRELKFNKTFSVEYALNESFRERVHNLSLSCNLSLNLSKYQVITGQIISQLGNVCSLNLGRCQQITDAGVSIFIR